MRVNREVEWRSAEMFGIRENIPEDLAGADDFHARA
jgi:hypothetical protein